MGYLGNLVPRLRFQTLENIKNEHYHEVKNLEHRIQKNDTCVEYDPHLRQNLLFQLKDKYNIINQELFLIAGQEQIEKDE